MEKLKILYLWTRRNLTKLIVHNGRPQMSKEELKEEVLRQFKTKETKNENDSYGGGSSSNRDDGVRG